MLFVAKILTDLEAGEILELGNAALTVAGGADLGLLLHRVGSEGVRAHDYECHEQNGAFGARGGREAGTSP